jgi:hypothetical protein
MVDRSSLEATARDEQVANGALNFALGVEVAHGAILTSGPVNVSRRVV